MLNSDKTPKLIIKIKNNTSFEDLQPLMKSEVEKYRNTLTLSISPYKKKQALQLFI
jgi:hypothetical protein